MEIHTLNVGQGQFVVVTGSQEAVIIDCFVPAIFQPNTSFVVGALSNILRGKNLIGLIVTGFDQDHFNPVGLSLVVGRYNPAWILYPQYYKQTANAN